MKYRNWYTRLVFVFTKLSIPCENWNLNHALDRSKFIKYFMFEIFYVWFNSCSYCGVITLNWLICTSLVTLPTDLMFMSISPVSREKKLDWHNKAWDAFFLSCRPAANVHGGVRQSDRDRKAAPSSRYPPSSRNQAPPSSRNKPPERGARGGNQGRAAPQGRGGGDKKKVLIRFIGNGIYENPVQEIIVDRNRQQRAVLSWLNCHIFKHQTCFASQNKSFILPAFGETTPTFLKVTNFLLYHSQYKDDTIIVLCISIIGLWPLVLSEGPHDLRLWWCPMIGEYMFPDLCDIYIILTSQENKDGDDDGPKFEAHGHDKDLVEHLERDIVQRNPSVRWLVDYMD